MTDTIRTVYHDDRIALFEKPTGLLAVPGRGDDKQDCLWRRVQSQFPTALVVHRLDRDTSGLIVLALDPAAQRELSRQFEARETQKGYEAVVAGVLNDDAGSIDLPLRKDFDRPPRHCVDPVHGRASQTRWRVLERGPDWSRVELEPLSGRSHQLRVHLASLGHPILGDPLYADDATIGRAPRLLLHAVRLTITNPGDGRRQTFASPAPF